MEAKDKIIRSLYGIGHAFNQANILAWYLKKHKLENGVLTYSYNNGTDCLNPLKRVNSILTVKSQLALERATEKVSIPSNGSIQFLQEAMGQDASKDKGLNPLKRVNSILTKSPVEGRH